MMEMFSSPELVYLRILLGGHLARAERSEGGASAVEWVVITAILVTIAVGLGAILKGKILAAANAINLGG